jgi:hypothetical protein
MLFTNGVHYGVIQIDATMAASAAAAETGFKLTQVALPANVIVELRVANDSAANTTLGNVCFNIHGIQWKNFSLFCF